MESMASALWSLYETQKAKGLAPAMRRTLFKLEKSGFRDDRWLNAMGELALLERNHQQAIRFFTQALKIKEKPEYHLNLGNAYYFAGDIGNARRILSEYLALNPGDAHGRLNLVNCHLRAGDYDAAEKVCEDGLGRGLEPAPLWNALGQTFFRRGSLEQALTWFRRAYEAAPDSVDALFNLSNTLVLLGRTDEAIEGFSQCVRKDEAYEAAWQNRAAVCLDGGRRDLALESVEKALQLNPQSAESHYLLARVRLESKELKLARDSLKRALRLQPEHLSSLLAMARICLLEEEKDEACSWAKRVLLRAAIAASPETVWALGLLVQMGQYEAGLQAMARMRAGDGGRIGFFRAICLWKTGKIREAIAVVEGLLNEDGGNTDEALTLLGMMLAETGAKELAESRFRAALEKQPGAVQASQQLATLLIGKGRPEAALSVLQEALERRPGHPDLLYNLACCQTRAGNLDDAWSSLQSAVDRGFDDVARLQDDEDLRPLRDLREFAPLLK